MNTIYQISLDDLTTLAAMLIKAAKEEARQIETMYTIEEVAEIVRRDKSTITRWHNTGILKHNSIGLYRRSDVEAFLSK